MCIYDIYSIFEMNNLMITNNQQKDLKHIERNNLLHT